MSTNYPTTLDTTTELPTESANTPLSTNHVTAHTNIADAVIALETKVGADSSAVATSIDYLLKNTSSTDPGHKHTLADSATDVTSTAAELNILDGATLNTTELNYVDGVTSSIQTQIDTKVSNTGNETIAGVKTFSSYPIIPDEAYSASWDGVLEPPTKNAVYDQIETIVNTYKNGSTTYDLSTATGTQNIAHGLGSTPKMVRISVMSAIEANGSKNIGTWLYNGTTSSVVGFSYNNGASRNMDSSGDLKAYGISSSEIEYQTGVISVDEINISISWTKTNGPTGILYINWEAVSGA